MCYAITRPIRAIPPGCRRAALALVLAAGLNPPPAVAESSFAVETPNYRIFRRDPAIDANVLKVLSEERERVHRRILDFLDRPDPAEKIDYHIYPSFEAKGLATGNTDLSHIDVQRNAIHLVINDYIRGDEPSADAALLIRRYLGSPATGLLEIGLAGYFSDSWRGEGYGYWASRLYLSGNMMTLADLCDNAILARASYLVAEPLAATFIAFAVERFGSNTLLEHYETWVPDRSEITSLEKEWHEYLDGLSARHLARIRADSRRTAPSRFQKGFCHAHEGYQIFNGYGSRKSDEALEKLASLGTNAISITPFSYMGDPKRPVPFRFSHHPGAENDEAVIHSAFTAKRLGMSVMLKPHIWLHGSWPGAVAMESEGDWDRFFDYYYQWMRHYALLAEIYQFDILCIGVELAQATVGHEHRWRALVDKLRGIYLGAFTYAANWGDEFERVAFWDAFDYIGINCYYPLSDKEEADDEDLKRGAQSMVERIAAVQERHGKPLLFTEIGFTSTVAPWKQPHEPAWRKTAFAQDQARCYEAVFQALYGRDWCRGIYWWKWPSFLEFGGERHPGFTPNAKPAEHVVRRWFERAW